MITITTDLSTLTNAQILQLSAMLQAYAGQAPAQSPTPVPNALIP